MKSSFRPPAISTQAAHQSSLVESERLSQLGQSSISFLSSGTNVLEDHPSRSMAVLVLVASAIFLYLQLFALPAIPRVATGDQSIYLNSAARIYEGQLIYRDYDQFTFPATDVLYLGLFKLFGVRAW